MPVLRGCDAGFLYVESRDQPITIPFVAVLRPDSPAGTSGESTPPLTFAALRARVEERLPALPALRWRLARAPLGLHRPSFVDDPGFDLDFHLRHVTLDPPGAPGQLDRFVADGCERLLDRRRPLWQLTLIDGLADGSQAVLMRAHHCLFDGMAIRTTMAMLLAEAPPTPHDPHAPGAVAPERPAAPTGPVTRGDLLRAAVVDQARLIGRLPYLATSTQKSLAVLKERETSSPIKVPALTVDTPVCSFNDAFSGDRTWTRTLLPMADVQAVRHTAGVTFNAVVLAVASGALRRYLQDRGELPDRPLTANMPLVSDAAGAPPRQWGNMFANFVATLATDVADPWERLLHIEEVATESRARLGVLGHDTIVRWLDLIPSIIGERGGARMARYRRDHRDKIDFSVLVSNLPGPTDRLSIGGRLVDELYVSGPTTDGEGLNITYIGYRDHLALAVLAHAEALADPVGLVKGFEAALAELVAEASRRSSADPVAAAGASAEAVT